MSVIVNTCKCPCNPSASRRPAWTTLGSSGLLYTIHVLDILPCILNSPTVTPSLFRHIRILQRVQIYVLWEMVFLDLFSYLSAWVHEAKYKTISNKHPTKHMDICVHKTGHISILSELRNYIYDTLFSISKLFSSLVIMMLSYLVFSCST